MVGQDGVVGYADSTCAVPGTNNFGFTVNCGDTLNLATVCFGSCSACVVIVSGCTGPLYCNYNPLATCNDGSCTGYGQVVPIQRLQIIIQWLIVMMVHVLILQHVTLLL